METQIALDEVRSQEAPRERLGTNWTRTMELWAFGALKIPMLFFLRPRVLELSDERVLMRVDLSRRARNHYGTMYFGALATGADALPGILAVTLGRKHKRAVSFFMKQAHATFVQKAAGDVVFRCSQGALISELIERSAASGEAVTAELQVEALLASSMEPVAVFSLSMSMKAK